jgi:phosphatidylinositol-3-phosphatase
MIMTEEAAVRALHRRRDCSVFAVAVLAATLLVGITGAGRASGAGAVPAYRHVVLAIFENHEQSQVIGAANAPYLTSLSTRGANFTASYAIEHPSQPNYLDLFSGSDQGVTSDACPQALATNNIAYQLISSGRRFVGYAEGLPAVGSPVCTSGLYARKHAPWTDFTDLDQNAVSKKYSSFPTDFTKLPVYSWVVPNLCHDMHNCAVSAGDKWASLHLDAYAQWAKTHNSLLIVTFDEDDKKADNKIATLFVGAHITPGNYSEHIDHFTVLRTIEDMYGLAPLGYAADRSAITDVFAG